MNHETVKVKFIIDPTRKNTWVSSIGYTQKENGRWWVYPSWLKGEKVNHGFIKRQSAEWWLKVAYAAAYREDGTPYQKGDYE